MARRIAYVGDPVLTLAEVAFQCRIELEDMEPELIEQIIIPGVITQCESKTGAAIRHASYEEYWPERYVSGHALDVGQVVEIESVEVVGKSPALDPATFELRRGGREDFLRFPTGRPSGELRIVYQAGVDLVAHPGVKSWLLMSAATAYKFRETLVVGQALAELPRSYLDHLLAEITVPPRF